MRYLTCLIIKTLPFAYMGFIWYLSSHSHNAVIDTGLSFDGSLKEALHLVEFAGLYVLWILAFLTQGRLSFQRNRLAVALSITYAFIDEFHQYFVPSRSATVIDFVKDVVGVAVVWYIINQAYFKHSSSKIGRLLHWITDWLMAGEETLERQEGNKH